MKSILLMVQNGLCSTIGKQPGPGEPADHFYRIEGCTSSYDLALVYLPDTPYKRDINLIYGILKNYFEVQK